MAAGFYESINFFDSLVSIFVLIIAQMTMSGIRVSLFRYSFK